MKGGSSEALSQVVKYQITAQYALGNEVDFATDPAKSTLELSEYLVHYNNSSATASKMSLMGRK